MMLEDVRARLAAASAEWAQLKSRIEYLSPRAEMDRMLKRINFSPNDFAGSDSDLIKAAQRIESLGREISELALAVDFLQWVGVKLDLAPYQKRLVELQSKLDDKSPAVMRYDALCEEAIQTRYRFAGKAGFRDPEVPAEDVAEVARHRALQDEMKVASSALLRMHVESKLEMRLRGELHPIFDETSIARPKAPSQENP